MTGGQAERALTPIVLKAEDEDGHTVDLCLSSTQYICYPYDWIASPDSREIYLLQGLVDIFTQAREKLGVPIQINSGFRTKAWQKELIRRGYKASKISPHQHGAAFDLSIANIKGLDHAARCYKLVTALKEAAYNLGLVDYFRYGCKAYNYDFVHFDIVPILFDARWKDLLARLPLEFYPYGVENPRPVDWQGGVNW